MDTPQLVNLCSRAWSLKALALTADEHPARISPLAAAARCSWTAMEASIDHLLKLGLLERNPGHGHPLRPEFRLTESGEVVAAWAAQLGQMLPDPLDSDLVRTKWSLAIVGCTPEETRFSTIKKRLESVTDRALSQALVRLRERDWIVRSVNADASPPLVGYGCGKTGMIIQEHLKNLPAF